MGGKRPRQRTAGDGVHHGRLDFHKAPRGHEFPQMTNHGGANLEHLAGFLAHDQVHIPPPVF